MADSSHSLSRLWLRQRRNDGVAHITYGCRHSWSNSLCGLSSQYLHSDEGVSSVCSVCSAAWQAADVRVMLPRGDVFVLDGRSGSLQRGPFFGGTERRAHAITRDLHPLSPESLGSLGVMEVSRGADGVLHGDRWCAGYVESAVESVPVSMGEDSVSPHCDGVALHCQRWLPQSVEDGFFAALAVCRARNGVLSVMEHSGWGLYEAVRHEQGMHGASAEVVCDDGKYEVRASLSSSAEALAHSPIASVALRAEHERTSEVWDAVKQVMSGWGSSEEARAELGRVTLLLAFASGGSSLPDESSAAQPLVQYGIQNGGKKTIINVCQARFMLGQREWISPLPANTALVVEEVLPRIEEAIPEGETDRVAEDLADFMRSSSWQNSICTTSRWGFSWRQTPRSSRRIGATGLRGWMIAVVL